MDTLAFSFKQRPQDIVRESRNPHLEINLSIRLKSCRGTIRFTTVNILGKFGSEHGENYYLGFIENDSSPHILIFAFA